MTWSKAELRPLPADLNPSWEQIRTALLRQSEPDWVPFLEAGLICAVGELLCDAFRLAQVWAVSDQRVGVVI